MRLFVAVEMGEATSRAAGALVDELRRRCGRLAPRSRVTWVAPGRMHLTVAFIGEVEEARVAAIEDALREPIAVAPFEMALGGAGAFPPRGAPRVLWLDVTRGREALIEVERHVRARLAATGVGLEERPFAPHVTLGRVRAPAGLRVDALFEGLPDAVGDATPVEAVTLFESRIGPGGSVHRARARTPLRAPAVD